MERRTCLAATVLFASSGLGIGHACGVVPRKEAVTRRAVPAKGEKGRNC